VLDISVEGRLAPVLARSLLFAQLEDATKNSSPDYLLVSPQRVLDVLNRKMFCLARPLPAAQPAIVDSGLADNTIVIQQMHIHGGSAAAATMTYDVQSVNLGAGVSAQHKVDIALIDEAKDSNVLRQEAEPSGSKSCMTLSPVSTGPTGGLASVSEAL
jgi:hypothetical protein